MRDAIAEACREAHKSGRSRLNEEEARAVLRVLGIPTVPGGSAGSVDQAVELAHKIGYPVVLKVLSPDILHKSDVGGVKLGLGGPAEVRRAWCAIMDSVRRRRPGARIQGMSVQSQARDGVQLIVGGLRDDHFGPVAMFGLGGIYTEVIGDVVFRLAPLTPFEIREMMQETTAYRLMAGTRGQEAVDLGLISRTVGSVASALVECEFIRELEINPLVVWPGDGAAALDALVTLTVTGVGEDGPSPQRNGL